MDLSRARVADVNDVLEGTYRYAPRGRWCSVKDAFYGPHFTLAECLDLEQRKLDGRLEPHEYLRTMQRDSSWLHRPRVRLARRFDPEYDDCPCLSVDVAYKQEISARGDYKRTVDELLPRHGRRKLR